MLFAVRCSLFALTLCSVASADSSSWYVEIPEMSADWQIAQSKTPRGHVDLADVPVGRSVCFFLEFDYANPNSNDFATVIPVTNSNGTVTAIEEFFPVENGTWKLSLGHYIPSQGNSSYVRVSTENTGSIPDNSSS